MQYGSVQYRMEIAMTRSLAVGLAAVLVLSAPGIGITSALADPPPAAGTPPASAPPAGAPVAPVTVTPAIPKTDGVTAKGKDTDIVCFREEETGSRLGGKRVCMTRAQYIQRARDAQNALDDIRRDRGVTSK